MNTETMTVHRALAELKTIDSRIESKISGATFCFANKHNNTKVNGVEMKDYVANMKSDFKSIKTLINRRNAMKRAICLSNATTKIEINGQEYYVAEAIEMKNHGVDNYKRLRDMIADDIFNAENTITHCNGETLEKKADDYVQGLFGSKEKVTGTEADNTRKAYIEANTFDFIDPLNVKAVWQMLDNMIAEFEAEIDSALSVSNAITKIKFSYEVE